MYCIEKNRYKMDIFLWNVWKICVTTLLTNINKRKAFVCIYNLIRLWRFYIKEKGYLIRKMIYFLLTSMFYLHAHHCRYRWLVSSSLAELFSVWNLWKNDWNNRRRTKPLIFHFIRCINFKKKKRNTCKFYLFSHSFDVISLHSLFVTGSTFDVTELLI